MAQPAIAEWKHDAGTFAPVIDRNRCEGCGRCVKACPEAALTLGRARA